MELKCLTAGCGETDTGSEEQLALRGWVVVTCVEHVDPTMIGSRLAICGACHKSYMGVAAQADKDDAVVDTVTVKRVFKN